MYVAETLASRPGGADPDGPTPRSPVRRGVFALLTGNVLALGMVSFITDISSEMVTAFLPIYLVTGLGMSMFQVGLLDGLYSGATVALRLIGAHVADRFKAHKSVAVVGYGFSALSKFAFIPAGSSPTAIGGTIALDRFGKGVRTAPRDALISLSTSARNQGRAFGLHRAMDTMGAFCGPLLAFFLLTVVGTRVGPSYDALFVVSACIGLIGVLVLVTFVRDEKQADADRDIGPRATFGLLRVRELRRSSLCAFLLGLATVSDSFVFLALQQRVDFAVEYFPLLPLGTAGVFLLAAVPFGVLSDRIGRWRVFLAGHVCLIGAYLLLAGHGGLGGMVLVCAVLALHGLFYACTDGVLMAHAAPYMPAELRTSGMALLQTAQALGRSLAAMAFGAAWMRWGDAGSLEGWAVALFVACLVSSLLARPRRKTP